MKFTLFSQVQLTEDIPEFNLKKGSIGLIVEHYPISQGEDGYSIEGLIAQDTVEVTESQIKLVKKELVDIKEDMAQTEKAAKAIEAEYEKAQELKQLTDEQFSAVKSALQQKSWRKTLFDYFLGFVLGVAGSLTASVIYSRMQQRRALADQDP